MITIKVRNGVYLSIQPEGGVINDQIYIKKEIEGEIKEYNWYDKFLGKGFVDTYFRKDKENVDLKAIDKKLDAILDEKIYLHQKQEDSEDQVEIIRRYWHPLGVRSRPEPITTLSQSPERNIHTPDNQPLFNARHTRRNEEVARFSPDSQVYGGRQSRPNSRVWSPMSAFWDYAETLPTPGPTLEQLEIAERAMRVMIEQPEAGRYFRPF